MTTRNDAILSDYRPNESVADGVTMERRTMLRLSAGTIAAALTATACRSTPDARVQAQVEPHSAELLEIGEFMAQWSPRARAFIDGGGEEEEAYLMGLSEFVSSLREPTDSEMRKVLTDIMNEHGGDRSAVPFVLVMLRLDPGKGFGHHDHRDYNGVIRGVEGEVRIRNYDILGDELVPPKGRTFQVQETRHERVLPGSLSTLGLRRDNVHDLVAGPEGARVLDAFTFLKRGARSHFMEVDATPRDAENNIYDAAWV